MIEDNLSNHVENEHGKKRIQIEPADEWILKYTSDLKYILDAIPKDALNFGEEGDELEDDYFEILSSEFNGQSYKEVKKECRFICEDCK